VAPLPRDCPSLGALTTVQQSESVPHRRSGGYPQPTFLLAQPVKREDEELRDATPRGAGWRVSWCVVAAETAREDSGSEEAGWMRLVARGNRHF